MVKLIEFTRTGEIMIIRIYEHSSHEYMQELKLRNKILRKPLGMNLYDEDLNQDAIDTHIGAFDVEKLVGCILLTEIDSKILKMRQIAVDDEYQGRKIGSGMIKFCEKYAIDNGYKTIIMHSRKSVINFYEKLGYETVGEEFIEVSIPHFEMIKNL